MAPSEAAVAWGAATFACSAIGLVAFFIDLGITTMRPQFIAFYSSATFVFLSFTISMVTIWGHCVNNRNPRA